MWNIQVTKDSFYAVLRDRIAAGNPARVLPVRGVLRPAVLVVENELPGAAVEGITPAETFCLRWTSLEIDAEDAGPLLRLGCEIRYASDGSTGTAGMDRGRSLAAMDAELGLALGTEPRRSRAIRFAEGVGGGAVTSTPLPWNIFWGPLTFAAGTVAGECLTRVAEVEVFGYAQ